jgi:hypothetical protein
MADYGQRQLRNGTGSPASAPSNERESDDLALQRAETARLQSEAQARINANQHENQIGSQP